MKRYYQNKNCVCKFDAETGQLVDMCFLHFRQIPVRVRPLVKCQAINVVEVLERDVIDYERNYYQ